MSFAATPPAVPKVAACIQRGSLPSLNTVRAQTLEFIPLIPLPSADQLDPFHFAM